MLQRLINTDKIKIYIGEYLYNFWNKANKEQLTKAKKELKNTLLFCEMDYKTKDKLTYEYYLICIRLGVDIDI